MAKVTVLIEGYARELESGWQATSSTTLIEDNNRKILVDPGINRELLLLKLGENNLALSDIDIVFLTHYHPDHSFLASVFENSLFLDGTTVYQGDLETEYEETIPGTNIKVVPTPGHTMEHCSLLVETNDGIIAVAGDVFWWGDNEDLNTKDAETLLKRDDPFVQNEKELIKSRQELLKIADWIIPGHGQMFRNPVQNKDEDSLS